MIVEIRDESGEARIKLDRNAQDQRVDVCLLQIEHATHAIEGSFFPRCRAVDESRWRRGVFERFGKTLAQLLDDRFGFTLIDRHAAKPIRIVRLLLRHPMREEIQHAPHLDPKL